jgi:AraC-like DNA-binding protein
MHVPYIYQCHAGLTEAITPIRLGNILIGYLFFGHVFPYESHEIGWENIKDLCLDYQIDIKELKNTCYERPITSTDYVIAASHILESVANYLCLERMVIMKNEAMPIQIDTYITKHLSEDLSSQLLCEHFQISRTHLYHISKENFGIGIADHIRNLRINKAKKLLSDQPDISIAEVASACGFDDYNYFISMFKRVVGMPPKQYMNSIHSSDRM